MNLQTGEQHEILSNFHSTGLQAALICIHSNSQFKVNAPVEFLEAQQRVVANKISLIIDAC